MRVGVLAFQGAFREHMEALGKLGAEAVPVRGKADMEGLSGVVIPGGESTVIGRFLVQTGLVDPMRDRIMAGELALMGTCAGAILACQRVTNDPPEGLLGVFPAEAERNHYGAQVDSFCQPVTLWDGRQIPGVFIRAPRLSPQEGASVLGVSSGQPVLMSWGRCLICSFHPELTQNQEVHRLFLDMASR
ncbi:pyridoxal 5'-phosphate synthase glutaminase subunit PdxT [Thermanaerovibrio acidaminovorans]|jgi:5'-phosphate synthase pdxT subunit|uniref:pyridoxal 5'-phosphate synthase glutaminase subunit PdxT n=1 Tax=Thermanaerovibrio acidaminovorans TaxID=81462 RepID=UPI002491BE7A|nr:pyridoxal 5'-phosphate synthase glutaminase subunit PdxT [Thermanaerovibrio acidaminovorans]